MKVELLVLGISVCELRLIAVLVMTVIAVPLCGQFNSRLYAVDDISRIHLGVNYFFATIILFILLTNSLLVGNYTCSESYNGQWVSGWNEMIGSQACTLHKTITFNS